MRSYNPGLDGEYYDIFYFYFYLALNDADSTKPLTATLEYADIGSESWAECPMLGESVLTASYEGDEDFWSCEELMFDILELDIGGDLGMMKHARIRVDYTLTNGVTGTVYSTDLAELFVYKGAFLREVSANVIDNILVANFSVDTGLVLDTSKLTLTQLTLDRYRPGSYYDIIDISGSAEVSSFAADGSFTVTYDLSGAALLPDDYNSLTVVYRYSDHDEFILWDSSAYIDFDVPAVFAPPTLDSASVEPGGDGVSYVPFTVTVGDGTKYGALTATLEHWNGSGYEEFGDASGANAVNTISLPMNDSTEEWNADPAADCLIADLAAENGFDFVRVVISYVDDGGVTQRIESDPMVVYKGTYVIPLEEESVFVGDGFFYAFYTVDTELVDIEKVETVEFTLTSPTGSDALIDIEWFTLDKETGEVSVRGEANCYGPAPFEYLTASVKLIYTDTAVGPVTVEWEGNSSVDIEIDPEMLGDGSPELINVEVIEGDSGPYVWVTFDLLMNAAQEVTAKLYYCDSIELGDYAECGAEMGTVELSFDNTTDPVDRWSTSPGDACFGCSLNVPWGLPGTFCWFYIEFECLMPDGTYSYVGSWDVPAYYGSFFADPTEYAMASYNPVNQEVYFSWAVFKELAPELDNVRVESLRVVPTAGSDSPVDLPTDCVTLYDGGEYDHHYAYVTAGGLALDYESEWVLELTLSYVTDEYTWTATQTVSLEWTNKGGGGSSHYPILPLRGPAGGICYEEKE